MSMLERLTPHFYLLTPLGPAEAHFLWVSDTFEVPVGWGCFQMETKENWWWPNQHVRLCESASAMRGDAHSPIHLSAEQLETLRPHILRHRTSPFHAQVAESTNR